MFSPRKLACIASSVFLLLNYVWSYKPVVIIHGILDNASSMNDLKVMVEKAHPGTNVTVVRLFAELDSILTPMWKQMSGVAEVVKKVMQSSKDGVHVIGYSQGNNLFQCQQKYLDIEEVIVTN